MARKIIYALCYGLNWVGQYALLALALSTLAMVVLRKLYVQTPGLFEVALVLALILYICTWPYTQLQKGHIRVNILVSRWPQRLQSVVDSITYLLSLGTCGLMSWWTIRYGYTLQVGEEIVAQLLPMPLAPLVYGIAVSFILLGVVILIDLVDSIKSIIRKQ